jgi:hypothetical protein
MTVGGATFAVSGRGLRRDHHDRQTRGRQALKEASPASVEPAARSSTGTCGRPATPGQTDEVPRRKAAERGPLEDPPTLEALPDRGNGANAMWAFDLGPSTSLLVEAARGDEFCDS